MTIFSAIERYIETVKFRGHTPGHKGSLHPFDITEIDTEFPASLIQEAQKRAAKYYSASAVRFLTGGSSMGIKAAVLALKRDIIVPSDCHRSVKEAALLAGVKLIELPLTVSAGLAVSPTTEMYSEAVKSHPGAAVIIQSPDYFGRCPEIDIETIKRTGAKIIADSAHGAHFDFCGLGEKSLASKADFCIMSAHKTLPALTMGSLMTVNDKDLTEATDKALELLGTTSPSYLILGSIEYSLDYCDSHRQKYISLIAACKNFTEQIPCLKNDDPTRLVIDAAALNTTGADLYEFCKKRGYVAEIATNRYLVFIITVMDKPEDLINLKEVILSYER